MVHPARPDEDALESAWDALEEGAPEEALAILSAGGSDDTERWCAEAQAYLDLGDGAGARRALGVLETRLAPDAYELAWIRAELALREWRLADAEGDFERCLALEPNAENHERLALLAELRGDRGAAERHERAAVRLDPDGAPPRLSEAEFAAVIDAAIEDLPPEFATALERCEIVVEPVPVRANIDPTDPAATPPDLLGLFVGESALDGPLEREGGLPPRILLFQRNLERASRTREELEQEIRVTLYHELGHLIGFDEDGVADMGLA